MSISEAKRLRELEKENRKLKTLLANSFLKIQAIKDVLSKKW
jgi:putative transposase